MASNVNGAFILSDIQRDVQDIRDILAREDPRASPTVSNLTPE